MRRVDKTVFVSYRRVDEPWAVAIYGWLRSRGFDVFIDYLRLGSGAFAAEIEENIRARAHFVVLLSPNALARVDEPGDWLRREIELAIELRRNVVPLLIAGFDLGHPTTKAQLSGRLDLLASYNAVVVPPGYFDAAMHRLAEQFLEVEVDAVTHPTSEATREITDRQRRAADQAAAHALAADQVGGPSFTGAKINADKQPSLDNDRAKPAEGGSAKSPSGRVSFRVLLRPIGLTLAITTVALISWFLKDRATSQEPYPTDTEILQPLDRKGVPAAVGSSVPVDNRTADASSDPKATQSKEDDGKISFPEFDQLGEAIGVAIPRDGTHALVYSRNAFGTIDLQTRTSTTARQLDENQELLAGHISPDGKSIKLLVAYGGHNKIRRVQLETFDSSYQRTKATLLSNAALYGVSTAQFSRDGRLLAAYFMQKPGTEWLEVVDGNTGVKIASTPSNGADKLCLPSDNSAVFFERFPGPPLRLDVLSKQVATVSSKDRDISAAMPRACAIGDAARDSAKAIVDGQTMYLKVILACEAPQMFLIGRPIDGKVLTEQFEVLDLNAGRRLAFAKPGSWVSGACSERLHTAVLLGRAGAGLEALVVDTKSLVR